MGPQKKGDYSFNLDLSSQPDGKNTVYVKTTDGTWDSNVVSFVLQKDTSVIQTPKEMALKTKVDYVFDLDISSQPDGAVVVYAKVNDGEADSNIVSLTLQKKTYFLEAPTYFTSSEIKSDRVKYTWTDNTHAPYNEDKLVLKDGNGNILVDNIAKDTTEYEET